MIKIEDIHLSFKKNEVLKGISLDVEKGQVISIIGPSGSGKSTLLRSMNFLEKPNKGKITFDNTEFEVEKMTKKDILDIRKYTTMVFQNYNLFKNKTALNNIIEGLLVVKKMNKEEAEKIGLELLKKVGLEEKRDFYPSQMSGGQQQRIAIARSLAMNPKVILLDEPTSALDPELVGEVLKVIKDIASEHVTMVIVTHEMQFAREIADRVIFIDGGDILEQAAPEAFFTAPQHPRARRFLQKVLNPLHADGKEL